MKLQYAEFIEAGSSLTESEAVRNDFDANALYLTVISEGTPGVTVEVHSGNDPENGEWFDAVLLSLVGEQISTVTVNGVYCVPMGGVTYVRVKNSDADSTLHVYGSFENAVYIPSAQA